MRKIWFLLLVFVIVSLTGCQKETDGLAIQWDNSDLTITVSELADSKNLLLIKDQDSLQDFQAIFSHAIKKDGIVNLTSAEYRINIKENDQTANVYVWVGEKGQQSTLMKEGDSHTIYIVSEKWTNLLSQLIMF